MQGCGDCDLVIQCSSERERHIGLSDVYYLSTVKKVQLGIYFQKYQVL